MDDLALYFSNNDQEGVDALPSKKQFSGKRNRKLPRPASLFMPPGSNVGFSLHNEPDLENVGICDCCCNDIDMTSCPGQDFLRIRNSHSCTCFTNVMPNRLPPEVEVGNIEYKRKLVNPTPNRFEHLVTQMKWRLNEGGGEAIYRLGVDDDGHIGGLAPLELASSLTTLERMAKRLDATVHLLRERTIDPPSVPDFCQNNMPDTTDKQTRKAMELLVRQSPQTNHGRPNLCLAVLGGMDAGKSTLIGVLTDGELDNARGRARLNLFRHLHEVQSGRTSCLSRELLGFDTSGNVTNYTRSDGQVRRCTVDELVRNSCQLITLLDSAGHSKYQRTTLAGLARAQPVGVLLVVSATSGLTAIGLEHAQLAFTLGLPMAVIISKIDQLAFGSERNRQITAVCRQISIRFAQLKMETIRSTNSKSQMPNAPLHPVFFPVSAVSGEGIEKLISFLSLLGRTMCIDTLNSQRLLSSGLDNASDEPNSGSRSDSKRNSFSRGQKEGYFIDRVEQLLVSTMTSHVSPFMCFWISEVFTSVPGVPGPVLFGTVQSGHLSNGHLAWLGPDQLGEFHLIQITSLHHNRQPYAVIYAGQTASVAVHFLANSRSILPNPTDTMPFATTPLTVLSDFSTIQHHSAFELDHDENMPEVSNTDTSYSLPRDQLLPLSLRRGMVMLSNASWSASYSELVKFIIPVPLKLPHVVIADTDVGDSLKQSVGVTWAIEVEVFHRLSIFPGMSPSPVVIPPLPLTKQRVNVYAGCIAQPGVVVMEADVSKSPEKAPRLRIRFTRHPEYVDVGRQVILTWAGCAKAVGRVAALHELFPFSTSAEMYPLLLDTQGCLVKSVECMQALPQVDSGVQYSIESVTPSPAIQLSPPQRPHNDDLSWPVESENTLKEPEKHPVPQESERETDHVPIQNISTATSMDALAALDVSVTLTVSVTSDSVNVSPPATSPAPPLPLLSKEAAASAINQLTSSPSTVVSDRDLMGVDLSRAKPSQAVITPLPRQPSHRRHRRRKQP
ncbi:GTP-binding protein 2 [Paragonimus heterotremus]|uniref:GTP-binding protein 2 n=1 Tax=Paragonimus heterotremus TaxID=100268 RepID=A0A8J4SNZ5_9TREM|nr:GTP-binding protein 2 [Paragonimus heterotremus]